MGCPAPSHRLSGKGAEIERREAYKEEMARRKHVMVMDENRDWHGDAVVEVSPVHQGAGVRGMRFSAATAIRSSALSFFAALSKRALVLRAC